MFGDFVKEKRLEKNISLRTFCKLLDYDASNWSKIERGKLAPPRDEETLNKISEILNIEIGSCAWQELKDKAYISIGEIPPDCLEDKELVKALPVFFRTLRNEMPTDQEINNLLSLIRKGI